MFFISINIIEYLSLFFLIVPLFYRILLWIYIWQLKEYNFDKIKNFLSSIEGKYLFFSKYFVFEVFLLVIFLVFNFVNLDINIYSYIAYIFLIYVFLLFIYDLLKIFTNSATYPRFTLKVNIILFLVLIFYLIYFIYLLKNDLFILILIISLIIDKFIVSFFVLIINPFLAFVKSIKANKAKNKIKNMKDLIIIPIIGSYGKTVTKMFLYQILSEFTKVQITPNNSNEIGIINFILKDLEVDTKILIIDLQSYKKNQIAYITNILNNNIFIITGIDERYYSLYGSIENLIKFYEESLYTLPIGGKLYLNIDSDYVNYLNFPSHISVITYGSSRGSDSTVIITKMDEYGSIFHYTYKDVDMDIETNIFGMQNIVSLIVALSIAVDMKYDLNLVLEKIKHLELPESTYKVYALANDNIIIDDTSSSITTNTVYQAIINLDYIKKSKKILFLDDIPELGEKAKDVYIKIANAISNIDILYVILVGKNYRYFLQEQLLLIGNITQDQILFDDDYEKIIKIFEDLQNSVILFEGLNTKKFKDLFFKYNKN